MGYTGELGDFLDAGAQVYSAIQNAINVKNTNQTNQQMVADSNAANLRIAQETNALNAMINERNINFQQQENALTRQREDNAVQRRAADLVRAGLSKTLAAGDAASANALQAPQANIPMQTGHEMKSAKNEAAKINLQTQFGNAMRASRQLEISDRALDIQEDQLAIERDKLEHTKAYDQAVLDENKRYHDLMDQWKKDELDQNSKFHSDAMALSWAEHELENNKYLTDKQVKEIQNLYYKFQIYSGNKKLTAELAEMAARTASYLEDARLSSAQISYIRTQARYVSELTANVLVERRLLSAENKSLFVDTCVKIYNLMTAVGEGTTTTSSIPSETEKTENRKDRWSNLWRGAQATGQTVLTVGVGAFLGAGGGKFLEKKLFDHDPFGGDVWH